MVTIPNSERRYRYAPVSLTTSFPVLDIDGNAAPIFSIEDVTVYKDGVLLPNSYTVTATFVEGVATDAVVVAASPGWIGTIDIVCDREPRRTDQFQDGRGVPASDQNLALNRLSAETRELYDRINRCWHTSIGLTGGLITFGTDAQIVGYDNASGNLVPKALANFGTNLAIVTPYQLGLLSTMDNVGELAIEVGGAYAALGVFDTRAQAIAATIPAVHRIVTLNGYYAYGDCASAVYQRVAAQPNHQAKFQSADGQWWALSVDDHVNAKHLGVKGDGTANEAVALQAWLDTADLYSVDAYLPKGTYLTQATLVQPAYVKIRGDNRRSILKWNSFVALPILQSTAKNAPQVTGVRFETIACSISTTSETIGTGARVFTVPAGLGYTAGNNIIMLANTVAGASQNYMIGTVTTYVGTTLTINVATTAVGAGTFANWLITRNDGNSAAVLYDSCTDDIIDNCEVGDYFYVSLRMLNTNGGQMTRNTVNKALDRGLYAYATSGTNDDMVIANNVVNGGGVTFYGINCNGSTAGAITNLDVNNNRVEGTVFQGISVGGNTVISAVRGNKVNVMYSAASVGILVHRANSLNPQKNIVSDNNVSGVPGTGIYDLDTVYCKVSGNIVDGCGDGILKSQVAATNLNGSVNDNIVTGCTGNGITWAAATASQCGQGAMTGNIVKSCTGTGILTNGSVDRVSVTGNVSQTNGTNMTLGGTNITNSANVTT